MFTKQDRKVETLTKVTLFAGCARKDLEKIAAQTTEVSIAAGRTVWREGARGDEALVILDGSVAVAVGGVEVAVLGPGDLVGELALLDGGRRVGTVTAVTQLRALALTRGEFHAVLDEVPAVARQVLTVLGTRLRGAEEPGHAPAVPIGI